MQFSTSVMVICPGRIRLQVLLNLAGGALLLEFPAYAGGGAPRAGAQDHHVHLTPALGQYLLGCGVVVGQRVPRVAVLVQDDRVRDLNRNHHIIILQSRKQTRFTITVYF